MSSKFTSTNAKILIAVFSLTSIGALIYYVQFYFHYQEANIPFPWFSVFLGHFGTYYLLLPISVPVIVVSRNYRIKKILSLSILIHLFTCLVFCFTYLFISILYNWLIGFSTPGKTIPELYVYALTHNFHIAFIAYWAVVAIVYVMKYHEWYKKSEGERIALIDEIKSTKKKTYLEKILVKEKGHTIPVNLSEIQYLEAFDNYIKLHEIGRFYLMRKTLSSLEELLDPASFCRIHRSFIVNLSFVQSIKKNKNGDASIQMEMGGELKVSRNYRRKLESQL